MCLGKHPHSFKCSHKVRLKQELPQRLGGDSIIEGEVAGSHRNALRLVNESSGAQP